MNRVSIADVRTNFERVARLGQKFLAEHEEYVLQEGSPLNGNAFRFQVRDKRNGGVAGAKLTGYAGYIGWTKREADTALDMIARSYAEM